MSDQNTIESSPALELAETDKSNGPRLLICDPSADLPERDNAADAPELVDYGALPQVSFLCFIILEPC